MSDSTFSAKEPSLGYFYQVQYGLLLLLNSKQEDNVKLLIESLDDIELQIEDKIKLYQAKFHLKGKTNLTDRSSDFWKTIRVWSEQISDKTVDIDNTIFTLITTENISTNSVILDIKNRNNIDEILKKLTEIAKEIEKNATNKQGYIAFNALSTSEQKILINNIHIIDSSLEFNDIKIQIKKELRLSVEPLKIDSCFERLTGWFLDKTILHLHEEKEFISFKELEQQLLLIIDSFKKDNLPMDFPDKISLTDKELKQVKSFNFLKQLQLINISSRMEKTAISDYYRAFRQKSKWLEENAIVKIFIGTRIKNLVPYTRESIQFLIYYDAININTKAELELISYRKKAIQYKNSNEIEDIYKKAEMLGKWLGRTGNIKTIYSLIGIKP